MRNQPGNRYAIAIYAECTSRSRGRIVVTDPETVFKLQGGETGDECGDVTIYTDTTEGHLKHAALCDAGDTPYMWAIGKGIYEGLANR